MKTKSKKSSWGRHSGRTSRSGRSASSRRGSGRRSSSSDADMSAPERDVPTA